MTTRSIIIRSVIFLILNLHQTWAFQIPVRELKTRELNKFRIPRAEMLARYMNESVDPCFDFYEFACGNWQNCYPATENSPITSPMKDLEDSVNRDFQTILEANVKKMDPQLDRKIKDFYASCMDSGTASESIKREFTEFVQKNSGMPAIQDRWDERSYDWMTQVSNLRKQYGMDILIGLNIKLEMQNRQGRIYIGEASTLLPKGICKQADVNNSRYDELHEEITENMIYWFEIDKNEASKFAIDLLNFETRLCLGMSEDVGPEVFPNVSRMTLYDLNAQFPSIMFDNFIKTSLKESIPIHQSIYLEHENYFHHLSKIIASTPKSLVANYVMYRALNTISFPGENNRAKRAELCVQLCMKHFSKLSGEMYNRKHFDEGKEEDVTQLWNKLIEAFKADIKSQLWLEENTRRQAIYKIARTQLKFPDYMPDILINEYASVKIDRKQFWQNILSMLELAQKKEINKFFNTNALMASIDKEVEAFNINVGYSPAQNIIRMPLSLLQPPVYHWTAPYSYKYGILGFLIARELVHGFDEYGWNYDEVSAMRLWWDMNSTLLYKERATCFRDQYVGYAGEDSGLSPIELDDKIREIIADNGALNISFNAYLDWLQNTKELHILKDETLSDVNYTNTQLFFISFAQNFCTSTYSNDEITGFFPWDVPNYLHKFKVNGLLWNMREFSREFNCLPGTEMNPGDKCSIY